MCQPGPTRSPGAFPRGLTGFGALPQDEIHGVFFILIHLDARAGDHAVQSPVAEFAVVVLAGHAEIDVAGGGISMASINQPGNGVDDPWNLAGGSGIFGRPLDVQRVHRMEVVADEFFDQLVLGDAGLLCPLDYLVVDIREVLDMTNLVSLVLEITPKGVKDHVAERVPDVGGGIRGHSAHVHLDQIAFGGNELLDLSAQGVVELHIKPDGRRRFGL